MNVSLIQQASSTYHVFKYVPQLRHASDVVIPNATKSFQKHFALLCLLHPIVTSASWKGRDNFVSGKLGQILGYEGTNTIIQHFSIAMENHVVSESMIL